MADIIFINGFISNEVPENAPEFILGKGALNVLVLSEWLASNASLANDKGYINYTIMRSKTTGKRYVAVDTYKAKNNEAPQTPAVKPSGYTGTVEPIINYDEGVVDISKIQF